MVERGNPRVVAIHRQQILGEIVAADGQKIHTPGQGPGLIHRRRHFDHHPDRRQRRIDALFPQLPMAALHQRQRLFKFRDVADHGQHDAQIAQPRIGLEHGAHLREQNLRVIEGDANTAPAEKGIRFLDREIGQGFVAAHIQGAHGHGTGREGVQLLAVNLALLFLRGEALAHQEGDFRAVQSDPFGAARARHIGHESRVDPQRQTLLVERDTGQLTQGLQIAVDLHIVIGDFPKAALHRGGGVEVNVAVVPVHHQGHIAQARVGQIDGAHHRGNTHGAGQNSHVRIAGAAHRDQPRQALPGYFAEHGRREFLTDQHALLGVDTVFALLGLQVAQHPLAEVFHIHRALAQVGVLHGFEVANVFDHDLSQGALGPLARFDQGGDLAAHGGVVQNAQVHIEQRQIFGAQFVAQVFRHRLDIGAHLSQGAPEGLEFRATVRAAQARHGVQVRGGRHDHRFTDAYARSPRNTADARVDLIAPRAAFVGHFAGDQGVGDHPGELRREGDQKGFLALVEAAPLRLLHNQHAEHIALVDDGHAKKRVKGLFADVRQQLKIRVQLRVFKVQRLFPFGHQADQTLAARQAGFAHLIAVQALRGPEPVALPVPFADVHATDLGAHGDPHPRHDDGQDLVQRLRRIDLQYDVAQDIEHGAQRSSALCAASGAASSHRARR